MGKDGSQGRGEGKLGYGMGMKTTIYVLKHPTTLEVRYVGKTSRTLARRLSQHICYSKTKRLHVCNWIKSVVLTTGKPPIMEAITTVEGYGTAEEIHWIAEYKKLGARLCNLTDGGEGFGAGRKWSKAEMEYRKGLYANIDYVIWISLRQHGYEGSKEEIAWVKVEKKDEQLQQALQQSARDILKIYTPAIKERKEVTERQQTEYDNRKFPLTFKGSAFLSVGKGRHAIIDAEDWDKVKDYGWFVNRNGSGERVRTTVTVNGLMTKPNLNQFIIGKGSRRIDPSQLDYRKCNLKAKGNG